MNKNRSKLVYFIAALLWGASYAVQKPLLDHINPISFTFWNFFLSGTLFLVYALYAKIPILHRWREGVVLGIFVAGMEILEMVGLDMTTSANTVFLTNLGMLIIPYVGYLMYRHRIRMADNIAIIIAIFGMYLLVGGVNGFGRGEFVLLASALSSAFYFIYSERFERERATHITALLIQQFFVIAAMCILWKAVAGNTPFVVESAFRWPLVWMTVLFTTIPYAIIQWASKWADEMVATLYDGVVEPLTGAVFSWVVFHEATTTLQVFGGVLMIASFVFAAIILKKHFIASEMRKFFGKMRKTA